ncbi:RIP metalloprotease RseP [Tindallia californiensis]|uniref:Zinc metalloprotease n=1 Tax=Tindallia californiensis TaxID=159292 RepID=A0A1H3NP87_9FIRM|nr:RIP metalloprotease RseP [Tindallia californiensis]SDY90767.1 regulator of sigma E protease [Tindallia californiensis]
MTTTIVAIFVFGLLVFFHELGHFAVAKFVGIKVYEFAIGMGPKVVHITKAETLYSIRALPIGGFVRMEGEDEESSTENSFSQKTVKERISVILAGPVMNFILGFLCFFLIFLSIGVPSTQISEVIKDSPAYNAGIQSDDHIQRIQGNQITSWEQLVGKISASKGEAMVLEVVRGDEKLYFEVNPEIDEDTGRAMIGIIPGSEISISGALVNSYHQTIFIFTEILNFLQQLIRGQADTANVAGPVGIISLVGEASRSGWIDVVGLAGLISINLGIMNLLPIPALDGSRIIFLILEGIRGKPINPEKEALVHMIGITLLMMLMMIITYKDILMFF